MRTQTCGDNHADLAMPAVVKYHLATADSTLQLHKPQLVGRTLKVAYAVVIEFAKGSEGSEGSYGASFPDVPGCYSGAKTLEEVRRQAAEGLRWHLEGLVERNQPVPEPATKPGDLDLAEYEDWTEHGWVGQRLRHAWLDCMAALVFGLFCTSVGACLQPIGMLCCCIALCPVQWLSLPGRKWAGGAGL